MVLALLALAACQTAPMPYLRSAPSDNPLIEPGARAGVLVRPVVNAPGGKALAEAVAAGLREREIAAAADAANAASYTLTARAKTTPSAAGRGRLDLTIDWYATDPDGALAGRYVQTARVDAAAWRSGADAAMQRLAAAVAPALAGLFGKASGTVEAPTGPEPLTVRSVDGAPGDGDISLRRAMGYVLKQAGYAVAEDPDAAHGPVLVGKVSTRPAGPRTVTVKIAWTVLAPDGHTLGTVSQANDVPRGTLDGAWGPTAIYAAKAAVPGIAHLVGQPPEAP